MDFHTLIFTALQSLIGVAIAVLVPVLVKFILSKTSKENLNKYMSLAALSVQAVQQSMGSASAEEKKKAAEVKLSVMVKGVLSAEEIDHLLESAVFLMKQNFDTAIVAPVVPVAPVPVAVPVEVPIIPVVVPAVVPIITPEVIIAPVVVAVEPDVPALTPLG